MNQTDMYLFLWELRRLTRNTDLIQINHKQSHHIQEKQLALVRVSREEGEIGWSRKFSLKKRQV